VKYAISSGRLVVTARSSLHDTTTTWPRISGEVDADAADLGRAALSLEVDMQELDAGDFLKNRKLKKDLELARHPTARFRLARLDGIVAEPGGFAAQAIGPLAWRGRELEIAAAGSGTLDDHRFTARARFDLDVRRLGVTPPRFLMFKVEDVVTVEISIAGPRVG
jgi:polyisoprenoid-binding protein YceI